MLNGLAARSRPRGRASRPLQPQPGSLSCITASPLRSASRKVHEPRRVDRRRRFPSAPRTGATRWILAGANTTALPADRRDRTLRRGRCRASWGGKAQEGYCGTKALVSQRRATVMDLFSGAGGLSLGFQAAGAQILATVDANEDAGRSLVDCFARLQPRRPPRSFFGEAGDIEKLDLERVAPADSGPDILVGGPPCQGFRGLVGQNSRVSRTTRTPAIPETNFLTTSVRAFSGISRHMSLGTCLCPRPLILG